MSADSGEPGDKTLLLRWKGGEQDAADAFYRRYVEKLHSLIRSNIARRFAARFEPADVIQSVMLSFFGAVADGRQKITPNDDVWKLLQTVALNKTRNQVKFHSAQKRSAARTVSDQDLLDLVGEPTDKEATEVAELVENTIRSLEPNIAKTMEMLLAGSSIDAISETLKVTTRSVRRYREQIADQFQNVMEQ